jgi:hypothetical protein
MSPGTLVSLVQLHCMDLTRENGTCLGKNGPTRLSTPDCLALINLLLI